MGDTKPKLKKIPHTVCANHIDPLNAKKAKIEAQWLNEARTFAYVAEEWMKFNRPTWSANPFQDYGSLQASARKSAWAPIQTMD